MLYRAVDVGIPLRLPVVVVKHEAVVVDTRHSS
jgi:hypothetical protein